MLGTANANSSERWSLKFSGTSASQHVLTISETTSGGAHADAEGATLYGTTKQTLVGGPGDDFLIGASGDV